MPENDLLEQAVAAARRGERRRARELFTKILRHDPKNEKAWLWMSAVVESDRERVFCLQSVLKLNPQNKAAESGLSLLGALPAKERPHSLLEDYGRDIGEAGVSSAALGAGRLGIWRRRRTYEMIGLIGLGGMAFFVLGFGVIVFVNQQRTAREIAALTTTAYRSPTPSPTASGTPTPSPTTTPILRTATPTLDPATPLAARLGVTVTPTVPYFETPHIESDNFQAGLRRYRDGDWGGVLEFMQKALDADPGLYEAYFYLGEAQRHTNRETEAITSYGKAIDLNADYAPAYWGRALAQASLSRVTAALADFERAIEADPNWPDPYVQRAILFRERDDLDAAKTELDKAITVAPQHAAARLQLALVLADLGRNDDALREIETAIALDPTLVENYLVRGRLRLAQADYDAARVDLGLYLTYRPEDPQGWYYRALAGVALDDEPLALADFERALALSPRHVQTLLARGGYLAKLGRYDDALADYDAALAEEENPVAHLGRGQVFYAQGDFGKAATDFNRAVARLTGDDPPEQIYAANFWLGRALVEDGRTSDAIAPLTDALEAAPSEAQRLEVYLWRARAYRGDGDETREAADLRALLDLWNRVPDAAQAIRSEAAARLNELDARATAARLTPTATATATVRTPTPTATRTARPPGATPTAIRLTPTRTP